ncbi:MAG: AzlC family ABC transporter permease [Bacillota bacterium]|nr:AzlC family ABC transporter permease [Bacillota bacterium]
MSKKGLSEIIKALKTAFPLTLPVLAGFFILGTAYGVLMSSVGLGVGWTFLNSFLVFAGSIQYAAIPLFLAPFNPIYAFFLTIMVNARHIFYGLSMLDKVNETGGFKPYIIFGLCDESFSIHSVHEPPGDVDRGLFMFFITFLNRWYWILSCIFGAVLGKMIPFAVQGLEFSLTALFVVIFLNQWEVKEARMSSILGIGCSLLSLLVFGASNFLIPAMILILAVFAFTPNPARKGVQP